MHRQRFQAATFLVIMLGMTAHAALADEMSRVQSLYARGEDLYTQAATIVANTPHSGMAAAIMVSGDKGPAGRFYVQDRAYQDDLEKMNVRDRGPAQPAELTLISVEAFLYGAVSSAVGSCNRADAAANLRVARSILNETKRNLHGHWNPDYAPPEIDPNGHVLCQ